MFLLHWATKEKRSCWVGAKNQVRLLSLFNIPAEEIGFMVSSCCCKSLIFRAVWATLGDGQPHGRRRIESGPSNLGINSADICRLTVVKVHSSSLCGGKVLKSWRMQNKKLEHISILFSINQQKKLTRKYLSRMRWLVQAIETEIEQINLRDLNICYGGASGWSVNNKHLWGQRTLSLKQLPFLVSSVYVHFIQLQNPMRGFVNSHFIFTVRALKAYSIVRATSLALARQCWLFMTSSLSFRFLGFLTNCISKRELELAPSLCALLTDVRLIQHRTALTRSA